MPRMPPAQREARQAAEAASEEYLAAAKAAEAAADPDGAERLKGEKDAAWVRMENKIQVAYEARAE